MTWFLNTWSKQQATEYAVVALHKIHHEIFTAKQLSDENATTPRGVFMTLYGKLGSYLQVLSTARQVTGIAAYFRDQYADQGSQWDPVAELVNIAAQTQALIDWLNSQLEANSNTTFTRAQLAGFRDRCDDVLNLYAQ